MGIRALKLVFAFVGALTGIVGTWGPAQAEPLMIGAPPSLRATLDVILPIFEKEYGATVHVDYSPSKTLLRKIENGAPIDVFLAAGVEEVEKLHKKGLTLNGGPRIYAQTSLVLVTSFDSFATSVSFREALPNRSTRIALGDPKTSSLGEITARTLTKFEPTYKNHSHLIHAPHSGELVNLLHTGKADVGIVYRVDAINGGQVRIIDETPTGTYTPVQFGQAVVWTCRAESLPVATKFSDFMMSPRIQKLLVQYGFDAAS